VEVFKTLACQPLSNIPDTRMRINSAGQWRVVISDLKQGFIIIPTCLLLIALKKAYATFTSLTVTENIFLPTNVGYPNRSRSI